MLAEPERTPYDWRFRLLGFPVRVHPWFWIGTALLGANVLQFLGIAHFAVWVVVVFVSILVHEMGHALAFRRYGADADIILYAFGGLAVPTFAIAGRSRRILIALAGPVAGFIFAGLVFASNQVTPWADARPIGQPWPFMPSVGDFFYDSLIFVNLYWGVLNLLPIFPLDGGQVSREVCGIFWGSRGRRISLQISFVLALVLVAYSLICATDGRGIGAGVTGELPTWFPRGSVWTAILFGMLAMSSYQMLQQPDWTDDHWDDRPPWKR